MQSEGDIGDKLSRYRRNPDHSIVEESGWMSRVRWSPDGRFIASYNDSDVGGRIWDAKTGAILQTFTGHTGSVWGMDWSANNHHLVTSSLDGRMTIWDTQSGTEQVTYSFGGLIGDARWSPDMQFIAVASGCVVRIIEVKWDTPEELITYAKECCLLRELTLEERIQLGLPERSDEDVPPTPEPGDSRMPAALTFALALMSGAVGVVRAWYLHRLRQCRLLSTILRRAELKLFS